MKLSLILLTILVSVLNGCGKRPGTGTPSGKPNYWFAHIAYSSPCGPPVHQPWLTDANNVNFEAVPCIGPDPIWPDCTDLHSDNTGWTALKHPDDAQVICNARVRTWMIDKGLVFLGGTSYVNFSMCLGSLEDMQKKMKEYQDRTRVVKPKEVGECAGEPISISIDDSTDEGAVVITVGAGCYVTEVETGSDPLVCDYPAECGPISGESACAQCAKTECCEGFNRCICGDKNCGDQAFPSNECSCRLECEGPPPAVDGCQTCVNTFGDPKQSVKVETLASCLRVNCADDCTQFLNY